MGSKRNVPERKSITRASLLFAGVPVEYIDSSLDKFVADDEKKELIQRYIDNLHDMYEDKINLLLYGANGTGKTYLSSVIARTSYKKRYRVLMITMAQILEIVFKKPDQRTEIEADKMRLIRDADFLIIDEVGKENFTRTGSNVNLLESILRRASEIGQVVTLITNLPLKELYGQYGTSIQSLLDGSFVKLEFKEADYRKTVLKQKKALNILLEGGDK